MAKLSYPARFRKENIGRFTKAVITSFNMNMPVDINDLTQKALKQVRALARGNGPNPDAIQIQKTDGGIIKCEAITHLEIHPKVTQEQKVGQHQVGRVLPNPEALTKAVKAQSTGAIKNTEVRKLMAELLLKRPDKGFAIHGEFFDLPTLNASYCLHRPCGTCNGAKRTTCRTCNGQRQETCYSCRGHGIIPCTFCHSTGFEKGPNGQQQQCTHCRGTRQMTCKLCQRRGKITCRQCQGNGAIGCNTCKSMGVFTDITHINLQMKTLFEIDRAALPHPAVKIIETKGGAMVQSKQIAVQGEQVKREDGGLAIQYDVEFPYATVILGINGRPLQMEIFGTRGRIVKLPAFLENMTGTVLALLEEAGKTKAGVQSKIIKASKTRIIGEALSFTLRMPRNKALLSLKKRYPIGITNDGLKHLIQASHQAIQNLTASARYSGYAIAGVFNLALNGAYFMGGVRDMVVPLLGAQGTSIVDFALIPLGGFIGALVTKYIAKRPLQKALGHFIKNIKAHRLGVIPNYGISLGAFILVLIILKFTGQALPAWFIF